MYNYVTHYSGTTVIMETGDQEQTDDKKWNISAENQDIIISDFVSCDNDGITMALLDTAEVCYAANKDKWTDEGRK